MRHPGKDLPRRPRRGILDEKPREGPPTEARCGTLHEGPRKRPPTEAPRGSQDLPRRPRCPRQRLAKPGTSQAFQRTRSWGTSPMHTSLASDAAIGPRRTSRPAGRSGQGKNRALASAATPPIPHGSSSVSNRGTPDTGRTPVVPAGHTGQPRQRQGTLASPTVAGRHGVRMVWARTGAATTLAAITPDQPKCSRCFARGTSPPTSVSSGSAD